MSPSKPTLWKRVSHVFGSQVRDADKSYGVHSKPRNLEPVTFAP